MRRFFSRALLVYEVGLFLMFIVTAAFITWPDPLEAIRLAAWLFLLIQPVIFVAHVVDHFSRRRRG